MNGTLIVTIKRGRNKRRDTHISKEPAKPEKFLSSISKSLVFSFGTRAGSEGMFLATPSKKRISQEETESRGRASIRRIPSPISIRKGTQFKRGGSRVVKAMEHSAFEVTKDVE